MNFTDLSNKEQEKIMISKIIRNLKLKFRRHPRNSIFAQATAKLPYPATRFTKIKQSSLGFSSSICAGVTSSSAVCGIVVLNASLSHC